MHTNKTLILLLVDTAITDDDDEASLGIVEI